MEHSFTTAEIRVYGLVGLSVALTVLRWILFVRNAGPASAVGVEMREKGLKTGQQKKPDFDDWLKSKQKEKAKPYREDVGVGPVIDV